MSMTQPPIQGFLPYDVELSNTIRKNWINVARLLRNSILSSVVGLGSREISIQRLSQTADESGRFYAQYYGEEVENAVRTNYLNYFQNVQSLIEAYLAGNMDAAEQIQAQMYANADELAAQLSTLNRYWDFATLQALIRAGGQYYKSGNWYNYRGL